MGTNFIIDSYFFFLITPQNSPLLMLRVVAQRLSLKKNRPHLPLDDANHYRYDRNDIVMIIETVAVTNRSMVFACLMFKSLSPID